MRFFRSLMSLVLLAYGLLINGYLTVYLICRDCIPLVAQANHLAHWITFSSVIALLAALIFRVHHGVLVWVTPGVIAFAFWYGSAWIPKPAPHVEGDSFTAATFNALDDITLFERANPDDTLAVIRGLDADIIAVQELGPLLRYQLENDMRADYPYQVHKVLHGYEGLGLLSRFPIVESETHIVVKVAEDYDSAPRYIRAVIDLKGRRVAVYNFHPTRPAFRPGVEYDDAFNQMNVRAMLDRLEMEELPILMLCDCNATPRSRTYAWLDDRFDNAFDARGWGFGLTFPASGGRAPFPIMRIDHIWYSHDFAALDAEVGADGGGSDHLPLWARLVLRES
jgi:endonuclease/exonuclease/phosphatase (EEP) superfamily protein YafD